MMGSANPNAKETFDKEKKIVNSMVETPTNVFVKYGVVQFGKTSKTKIPLGNYVDENELKKRVKTLPWDEEGKFLDEGIKIAGEEFEKNGRPKARKVLVVFMDGNDDSDKDKLKKVTEPLKKNNTKIVPVILGEVDEEKVKELMTPNKKPKKGKDPKKMSKLLAEDTLNGNDLWIVFSILKNDHCDGSQ